MRQELREVSFHQVRVSRLQDRLLHSGASPFTYLERCHRRYGSHFTLRATSRPPLVFLSDLSDIRAMLTAPADVLHPGEGADTIEPLVGEKSFMLREEDEHLSGRRAILPPFHAKVVQQHAEPGG